MQPWPASRKERGHRRGRVGRSVVVKGGEGAGQGGEGK